MKEYKVVGLTGLTHDEDTHTLNALAVRGWVVKAAYPENGLITVILERELEDHL